MSAKYSDERLEEILSEFRDKPDINLDNTPEAELTEEPVQSEAAESEISDEQENKPEDIPAEEDNKPRARRFPRVNISREKLLGSFSDKAFSGAACAIPALALVLFIIAWALPTEGAARALSFILPYLLAGYKIIYSAAQSVRSGKWLDESFIITFASLTAICLGLMRDAAALMILFAALRLLLAYVELRGSTALETLVAVRPESARIEREDGVDTVSAHEILVGEYILADPGEAIALDGEVIEGMSSIDVSAIAGRSLPRTVTVGDKVFAGSVNISSPIKIRVTAAFPDTVASRAVNYISNASERKSELEKILGKFSRLFTPVMLALAFIIAIVPSAISGSWLTWLGRALIILALSSSGALSVSVALSYFGGVSTAARSGIIIKGDSILEALAHLDTVIFDKTGTITEGRFDVTGIFPQNMSERELLDLAATAESCSEHPIARSLREIGHVHIPEGEKVLSIEEIPGRGVSAFIGGKQVYVGNAALLQEHGISFTVPSRPGSAVHVAADGEYAGHIMISDRIRDGAFDALEELRSEGAKTLVMLTGDVRSAAKSVAASLNFDMVKSELSPAGKLTALEYMLSKKTAGSCIAFVGDGVSDREVLERADISVAMAALGSDEAIDFADALILGEDIRRLPLAARISRLASGIIRQNIIIAAAVKLCALLLGVFGIIPLWIAALMDSAASAAVIVNSLRTFNKNEKE